jgi:hypothetical protein
VKLGQKGAGFGGGGVTKRFWGRKGRGHWYGGGGAFKGVWGAAWHGAGFYRVANI